MVDGVLLTWTVALVPLWRGVCDNRPVAFDLNRAVASQKALPAHPAFMGTAPVSTYSPGANSPRTDAVISKRESAVHQEVYGGRATIDHVHDCINLFADPVATSPYRLEKEDGTKLYEVKRKGTPPDHQQGPKDLYDLLKRPNPFMLWSELASLMVIDLLLGGDHYWFKWQVAESGKPMALYRLAPAHVKITPGQYGPKNYKYQPPGARQAMTIQPENVIHFKRPNPHSAYYGMGVVQGAGRAMDLEIALTDTMAHYYENRAMPSVVVSSERRVPRDIFNKVRLQLRARMSGQHNAGEMVLLENGLKASTLDVTAADALFVELSRMSRDRLYAKFRASPMLFGLMDEQSGANKVSDVRREFDNYTLRPFIERLQEQITAALLEPWGVRLIIDHKTMLPPEEAVKVGGEIAKLPGIKVRELRRQYAQFGIEESTGDPEIDEMLLNLPGEELDENGQGGFADRPLPGEPGRPPLGENTKEIPTGGQPLPAKAKVVSTKAVFEDIEAKLEQLALVEAKAVTVSHDEARESTDSTLPGEVRAPDPFARARQADIDAHRDFIARGMRDAVAQLEREMLDIVEGKALKTSDLVQRVRRSEAWKTFQANVTKVLEDGARMAAMSGVMHSDLRPDEDVDYDSIVKSTVHRPDGVRKIVKTLRDRVAAHVKDVRDKHGERQDFEAEVRTVLNDYAVNQVATIADSEATEAYNEAALTIRELAGETEVVVHEEEDAPDEECIEARGQTWTIEFARQHRKAHPRCRRAFLSVPQVA